MLQVLSVRLRELQVGGKEGRVGLPCGHRPSVCLLSLFGFSSLGQRSRGTGENLVSNAREKKKDRETSGKFCNFRQEKGQTLRLLTAFQAWL